jgi:uncharacterized protein
MSVLWTALPVLFALFAAFSWYLVARARWAFALDARARNVLLALLVVGFAASAVARGLGIARQPLAEALGLFGSMVVIGVLLSSVLLLPTEVVRWLALRKQEQQPEQPARREFLARAVSGGAIALGAGSAVYGTLFGRRDYSIDTVPITLEKLPRALDGFTIVQLSDLHVGTFIGERELAAALSLVRDARPDLIVLTGDLIDHDAAYAPVLGRFARSLGALARYGVHAIPGNHDYYGGVDATLTALQRASVNVMRNQHVRIGDAGGSFLLAGLDDISAKHYGRIGPQAQEAFADAGDQLARVVLSHNPAAFERTRAYGDLTLSGHTHGGQISLFINPAALVLKHGKVRGHYQVEGSQLYVNRGFGTAGPPTRIGSAPEVTRLILASKA